MCVQEDPAAILDIKEDIREECSKMGPVTNVVLFDKETDGVASVRYSNAEAADACVKVCTMSSVLLKLSLQSMLFLNPRFSARLVCCFDFESHRFVLSMPSNLAPHPRSNQWSTRRS